VPLFGHKRKLYIFVFGLLISICFLALFLRYYELSAIAITIFMMAGNACLAFMATVTDAICCMIAKKDYQLGT
jgi:hypothetical protein